MIDVPLTALGPTGLHGQAIRSTPNPFDKATVFSVYPIEITEKKATTQPCIFVVPPGTNENPGRLVVGPSSWWRTIEKGEPLLEIVHSAIQVADSIVNDYCWSRLEATSGVEGPGLFYVPGEITTEKLKKELPQLLSNAIERQRRWYLKLVKLADTLWARTNGDPRSIDDTTRLAAKELGMTREWITTFAAIDMVKCVGCGNMRNPTYPICPHCKLIVDTKKAAELNLTFAK